MLKNKSVGKLIRGGYANYISLLYKQDSPINCFLGQRSNLCSQRKASHATNFNLGKRVIEDGCSNFTNVHSATSAPLATALYGIRENPKCTYDKLDDQTEGGSDSDIATLLVRDHSDKGKAMIFNDNQEELRDVEEGDIIDLHELLFTKDRNYLIKHNGTQVKAEQLTGKVIVLYFLLLPLDDDNSAMREWLNTERLKDIYNFLPPNKGFEVVFVAADDVDNSSEEEIFFDTSPKTNLENHFEDVFSCMPWTAIPFSDRTSRKRLQTRFGFRESLHQVKMFVIDSAGVVLQILGGSCFAKYGVLGYPFSEERLKFLDSKCKAISKQPTLEKLLSSPERDYIISNNGDKVPIHTLEDKVVALYFHADNITQTERLTEELKKAYKELAEKQVKFEVVLLYLHDTHNTFGRRNEESFWKTFGTMPWLALPYKDPNLKKLKIIYEYPDDWDLDEEMSRIVIVGPHGEFCEPCGDDILLNYKVPGYPFTREKILELETERIKELKLEMIWEGNTVLSRNDGFQVSLSQLAGKRIMLLFGLFKYEFLNLLKERYLYMKGTDGEFEVIHIYLSDTEDVLDPPWFVYRLPKGFRHASDIIPFEFDKRYFKDEQIYDVGARTRLLAFDQDGMIVRDTAFPTIEDMNFPFYTSGLEKENLLELDSVFHWYEWEDTESWNREAGYVGPNQSCG